MLNTKSTFLGNGTWGCRVFYNQDLVIECTVNSRKDIGSAFRDMIRTLDKCGGDADTSGIRANMWKDGKDNSVKPNNVKFYSLPKELSF